MNFVKQKFVKPQVWNIFHNVIQTMFRNVIESFISNELNNDWTIFIILDRYIRSFQKHETTSNTFYPSCDNKQIFNNGQGNIFFLKICISIITVFSIVLCFRSYFRSSRFDQLHRLFARWQRW